MKNIKIIYIAALCILFTALSCSDVLDTESSDAFAEDLIYNDPAQVERLVYTMYNSTESWGFNKQQWWSRRFNIENASYESKFNFNDLDLFRLQAGLNANNAGIFNEKWGNYFDYVRLTNEFLDNIDTSGAMEVDPDKVNMLKGEVLFLRANLYAKLLNFYGGVPIMEHALGLNDDFNLTRNTYEECVNFIVNDLNQAMELLPETRSSGDFGRATVLSAAAVKSRTLLYAASKLHDPNVAPSGPLFDYPIASKWQDASDAALNLINMVGGRNLIPVTDAEGYQKLFLSPNDDILFARPYGSMYYDFGTDVNSLPDQTQSPSGYGGWALSSPTHNFALQFNMADGSTTNGGTFDPNNPNANRELRYYANLNYNGAMFRGRDVQYYLSEDPNVYPNGLDSPEGLGNVLHSSKTGYNIRKFQDESLNQLTDISPQRPFILYRLAEVYLNYAEAQFQLGNEGESRLYLNKVAQRALLPEITASGQELYEAIKRERRIELAFEGHSFFDDRRWMDVDHLGFDMKGLKWTKATDGTVSFKEVTVLTRPWFPNEFYLPIPASEIEKAPNLIQNDGY
ncbi:RagB/SusD family nutrient uptake outer membrane protein [Formosa sp. PL04]|uniref:RagB/SusD family nutrient uptake outer membrane protein n=1 Tax=Formosa sp. PL04 TaxID=3081755 RepID=UPI00298283B1|nr:RagB/SusD family nutrient uptake outer membrane protein [Formosa sp. PL04]MDW5288049.1 RagB/SusD family nutrient uptake outer membrane protein [Formosa sp. PL04]